MKRKKLSEEDILNWWLEKYHSTNVAKVQEEHPEWKDGSHHREFYETYQVTQAQYDEWREWLVTALMKDYRASRKYVERHMWAIDLNLAPMINDIKETK